MKGFYINLVDRKDRRIHFENLKTLYPLVAQVEWLCAIENIDGPLGCCLSHLKSLTRAKEDLDEPYVAIFEDDFTVLDHAAFLRFAEEFDKIRFDNGWKVIVLTPRGTTVHGENIGAFKRIVDNQTATGYIVKKDMIPILIDTFKESLHLQIRGVEKDISAHDQYWKRLQTEYPFYYYSEIFAGQLVGWSNIEKRMVDYNDRFIKQNLF